MHTLLHKTPDWRLPHSSQTLTLILPSPALQVCLSAGEQRSKEIGLRTKTVVDRSRRRFSIAHLAWALPKSSRAWRCYLKPWLSLQQIAGHMRTGLSASKTVPQGHWEGNTLINAVLAMAAAALLPADGGAYDSQAATAVLQFSSSILKLISTSAIL